MHPIAYRISLPRPPLEMQQQALDCLKDIRLEPVANLANQFDQDYTQRLVQVQGQCYVTRYQTKYVLHGWQEWCREHIDSSCFHSGIAVNDGPSAYHGPHADAGRTWALLYLIEPGGPDVTTSWWQHPDHALILDEELYPKASWHYHELRLVTRERFKTGSWYLFHGRVLHSVENATGRRISLQTNVVHVPKSHTGLYAIG